MLLGIMEDGWILSDGLVGMMVDGGTMSFEDDWER
jgi:hypothetical protein